MSNAFADLRPVDNDENAFSGLESNEGTKIPEKQKMRFSEVATDLLKRFFLKSPEEENEQQKMQKEGEEEPLETQVQRYVWQGIKAPLTPLEWVWDMARSGAQGIAKEEIKSSETESPEDKEAMLRQVEKNFSGIPTSKQIEKNIEEATGRPITAKTAGQKIFGFAAETGFGAALGLFGENLSIPKTAVASGAAKAALQQTPLKEELTNLPVPWKLKPPSVVNKPSDLMKRLVAGSSSPEQLALEVEREALGLPQLPLSETTEGIIPKAVQGLVKTTDIGQKETQAIINDFNKSFIEKIEKGMEQKSKENFNSLFEIGEAFGKEAKEQAGKIQPETLFGQPFEVWQPFKPEGKERQITRLTKTTPSEIFQQRAVQPNRRADLAQKKISQGQSPFTFTMEGQFRNGTNRYRDTIAPTGYESNVQGGRSLMETLQGEEKQRRNYFTQEYQPLIRELKNTQGFPDARLAEDLDTVLRDLRGSYFDTPIENSVMNSLQNLRNEIAVGEGTAQALREVNLGNLVQTKQSLNRASKFEGHEGFRENLGRARQAIDAAIERNGERIAPELHQRLRELNKEFSDFANTFENDTLAPYLNRKNRDYKTMYNKSLNIDDFNELRNALSQIPGGDQIAQKIQRDLFDELLGDKLSKATDAKQLDKVMDRKFLKDLQDFGSTLTDEQLPLYDSFVESLGNARKARHLQPIAQPLHGRVKEKPFMKLPYLPQEEKLATPLSHLKGKVTPKLTDGQLRKEFLLGIAEQDPEKIIRNLDSISDIRRIKKFFSGTDKGKELFDAAAKYKFEKDMAQSFFSLEQGQFDWKNFQKQFFDKDNMAYVSELMGPEFAKDLKRLHEFSFKLSPEMRNFKPTNTSQAKIIRESGENLAIMAAVFTNPQVALSLGAAKYGKKWALDKLARIYTDKKTIKEFNELAKASAAGDIKQLENANRKITSSLSE